MQVSNCFQPPCFRIWEVVAPEVDLVDGFVALVPGIVWAERRLEEDPKLERDLHPRPHLPREHHAVEVVLVREVDDLVLVAGVRKGLVGHPGAAVVKVVMKVPSEERISSFEEIIESS